MHKVDESVYSLSFYNKKKTKKKGRAHLNIKL